MTPPPIQQPGQTCPQCGAYMPQGQGYCANCGYGRPQSAGSTAFQVISILLLIFIGLPAACLGSCFLAAASSNSGSWSSGGTLESALLGLVGFVILIGLIVLVVMAFKKKR